MPDETAAGRVNESRPPCLAKPSSSSTKMRAPFFRRPSLRSLVVPVCALLALLVTASCWFNAIEWNGGCATMTAVDSERLEKSEIINAVDLRKISDDAYARSYSEPPPGGACRRPAASHADIDTVDVFPQLNFNPDYIQRREFWDSTLEKRYADYKKDTSRPPLKVIVLPHSHVDPGWLKTFEDYYAGQTRSILDNVAAKLSEHKNMTFIWTEIAFFALWWDSAGPTQRRQIKRLVDEGRLEFTSGTWVMTDEATPHLYSMLDQMIEGHQWLKSNLGISPKSAWTVDPFGHGPVAPYLLRASGLRNTVVQRIHYGWKRWLADKQVSDFYWRMPWTSGSSSDSVPADILCHNFPYDIYSVKHSCGPNPKTCLAYDFRNVRGEYNEFTMNSVPITRNNVQKKAEVLLEQYAKTGSLTRHNVVLALVGDDFRFDHDVEWDQQYFNYQNIFNYVNANADVYGVEIGFGTLSDYFDAVRSRAAGDFPALRGDFFPYADIFSEGRPAYWTGYYTSRPFYKALAREVEARLRGAEILYTLAVNRARQYGLVSAARIADHDYASLVQARRSLALFQHHDAITGTSKAFVMRDYGEKLFAALKKASAIESRSAAILLTGDDERWRKFRLLPALERTSFDKLAQRLSIDLGGDLAFKTLVLYNSEPHHRHELVRIKLNWPYVLVVDPDNETVAHQVNPVWTLRRRHRLEHSPETFQLVFIARLAPLSLTAFRIRRLDEASARDSAVKTLIYSTFPNETKLMNGPFQSKGMEPLADIQVENAAMRLLFDGTTGLLKSVRSKATNKSTACSMLFAAYPSSMFHSGAYLFMPDPNAKEAHIDVLLGKPQILIISGPVMSEVSVVYSQLLVHSTVIFHNKRLDGLIWMESSVDMGPAPNYRDHEFFIRFKTGVHSYQSPNGSAEFFTDQNGFAFARRVRVESLGVEANYYPITSAAFIEDAGQRLNLLVNRATGFTSLHPGWMEFMVDRRTIHDDGRGMGEGVTDNYATSTPFVLMLEERSNGRQSGQVPALSLAATHASSMLTYPATLFVVDSDDDAGALAESRVLFLNRPLPCNVQLVGLRSMSDERLMDAQLPSSSALLTLHNRAFDCSIVSDLPLCGLADEGQVFYRDTSFVGLYTASVQRTTLTGIESLGPVDFNTVQIPLMELASFNLTFA